MAEIPGGMTMWARQTIDSEIFMDKPHVWFKIWFYLVCSVNHAPKGKFERGECFVKYEWISQKTGSTKHEIDHCVRWLKKCKMLATRKATRGMVIKVLRYEYFQDITKYKSDTKSDLSAKQRRHRSDTINNNGNNDNNDNKKIKYKSPTKVADPNDLELSQLLLSLILENLPNYRKPENLNAWTDEVRKMREIDKRTYQQIKYLIEWCQKDTFWQSNILSMTTLRKKSDQLIAHIKREKTSSSNLIIAE